MTETDDYYAILGVLPSADEVVVRAAYRALSQKYHPDKWSGEPAEATHRMQQLNRAYEVLSNIERRQQYDRQRSSDNPDDDFDFTDETMRSAFQEAEKDQEANWTFALEYYPDLAEIHSDAETNFGQARFRIPC
jgi:curved DNA-binding protein CbpA